MIIIAWEANLGFIFHCDSMAVSKPVSQKWEPVLGVKTCEKIQHDVGWVSAPNGRE